MHAHPRTNRIPVALRSHQPERNKPIPRREIVSQQPQPRRGAIGYQEVEISIAIPVNPSDAPPIIRKIETRKSRNVTERSVLKIEKTMVLLASTEAEPLLDDLKEGFGAPSQPSPQSNRFR